MTGSIREWFNIDVKRINGKLFPVIFLISVTAVIGIGAVHPVQVTAAISDGTRTETVGDTKVIIATTSLPAGVIMVAYRQSVSATGGEGIYHWSKLYGFFPAGLTITDTGLIYGTPTVTGESCFTLQVTDSQNPPVTATKTLSVIINPPALAITTPNFSDGAVRKVYKQNVHATGGFVPYIWSISAGSLPAGLSFDTKTGVIVGIPTTAGTSTFTLRVTDSQNPATAATKVFSIKIPPYILPHRWFSPI